MTAHITDLLNKTIVMADTGAAVAPAPPENFQMQPLDLSCPTKKDKCQDDPEDYSATRPREPTASTASAVAEEAAGSGDPAPGTPAARHHPVYLLHRFKRPRSSDSSDARRTSSSGSPDAAAGAAADCASAAGRHGPARKRFLTKFRREDDAAASAVGQPSSTSTPLTSRRHSDNAPGKAGALKTIV